MVLHYSSGLAKKSPNKSRQTKLYLHHQSGKWSHVSWNKHLVKKATISPERVLVSKTFLLRNAQYSCFIQSAPFLVNAEWFSQSSGESQVPPTSLEPLPLAPTESQQPMMASSGREMLGSWGRSELEAAGPSHASSPTQHHRSSASLTKSAWTLSVRCPSQGLLRTASLPFSTDRWAFPHRQMSLSPELTTFINLLFLRPVILTVRLRWSRRLG